MIQADRVIRIFLLQVLVPGDDVFDLFAAALRLVVQVPRQQRGMVFQLVDPLGRLKDRHGHQPVLLERVELVGFEPVADDGVEAVLVDVGDERGVQLVHPDADREEPLAVDGGDSVGVEGDLGRTGRRRDREEASGGERREQKCESVHQSLSFLSAWQHMSMTTVLARISTSFSPGAMSTPYVSRIVNHRFDTVATVRPPRSNVYSWSIKLPVASRSSGPGTSTVNFARI